MEYVPDVSIYNTNKDELEKLRNEWGFGNLKPVRRKKENPKWKHSYCWRMSYLLAYKIAEELEPFVRLKKPQINLLLEYRDWIQKQKKPFNQEIRQKQEEYRYKFQLLNERGRHYNG
jgi:hypothetical protein